ncbi:MAG: D-glucuronyl C5-epimerase family protein [Reichenbachiella sp.]|uniref:D-glucuronyl C5-epimerase family protein n=1 Tax=Reichenbachiella sp. TaxID=2184521 RepID=UPI0032994533
MKAATKSYQSFNTIKQYWTLDSTDYWHLQYKLNSAWKNYYWDMSEKAFQCKLPRDEDGVTTYAGEDGNTYYSSIELAQYSMAAYQAFLITSNNSWLDDSVRHIEKFMSLSKPYKQSELTVLNQYPVSLYDIDHPWPTALGFGVALSVLVRLYEELDKMEYLEFARNLVKNFSIPVDKGGILRNVEYNGEKLIILEEYATENLSGVLNGHIFGLWGLYDLGKHDKNSLKLFEEYGANLANNLKIWNGNYWSLYDATHLIGKKPNYASIHYHMLHVKMLFVMFSLTGDARFANFCELCIKAKYGFISRTRAFLSKFIFRLFK